MNYLFSSIRFASLVALCFCNLLMTGQTKDSIVLNPSWKKGETLVYAMVNTDELQNKNGHVLRTLKDTNFIFITPEKISNNQTLLSIKYRRKNNIDSVSYQYLNEGLNHEIIVSLDEQGQIAELFNWQYLASQYLLRNQKNLDSGLLDSNQFTFFQKFYNTKEQVEVTVLEDINKLFLQFGNGYRKDNKYLIGRKLVNPFMGEGLVVRGTSTLTLPAGSRFTYQLHTKCGTDSSHYLQLATDFTKYKLARGMKQVNTPPQFYIGNEEMTRYNIAQKRITYCYVTDTILSEIESRYVGTKFVLIDVIK